MLYAACRYPEQERIIREEYEEMEELGGVEGGGKGKERGWGYQWLSKEEVGEKVKNLPNVQVIFCFDLLLFFFFFFSPSSFKT